MKLLSTASLRELVVINLCGGEKLGYTSELEIDVDNARIVSLTVEKNEGFICFGKKEEYVIPWKYIQCIGEDAILVKLEREELLSCQRGAKTKKKK